MLDYVVLFARQADFPFRGVRFAHGCSDKMAKQPSSLNVFAAFVRLLKKFNQYHNPSYN